MAEFRQINLNPFKIKTGDCVVRSLVGGTLLGYKTISDLLGVRLEPGMGVIDGVMFKEIEGFSEKTGIILPLDLEITPEMNITASDMTYFSRYGGFPLKFWVDNLQVPPGENRVIFESKLQPTDLIPGGRSTNFHVVFANLARKEYYDTWDSGNTVVFGAYYVDPSKVAKKDSPDYYKTEADSMRRENMEYLKSRFRKS